MPDETRLDQTIERIGSLGVIAEAIALRFGPGYIVEPHPHDAFTVAMRIVDTSDKTTAAIIGLRSSETVVVMHRASLRAYSLDSMLLWAINQTNGEHYDATRK